MVHKYKILFITGLLLVLIFLFPRSIFADEIAGNSAQLKYLALNTNTYFIPDVQFDALNLERIKYKKAIQNVLTRYQSPMIESVDSFMEACIEYDLDCFMLPAIAGLESRFGNMIAPATFNPFGWGGGYITFESWDEAVMTVAKGLRKNYYDKGAKTVEDVGYIYANKSTTWAGKIRSFMNELKREYEKKDLISSAK